MKTIKLVAMGLLIATSYNCKEAKKETQEAAEDIKEEAKEVVQGIK